MPADFLAVAEETGMIVPIGRWVLEQACAHARRAEANADAPQGVSINMSGRNLLRTDYPEFVGRCLEEQGLDPVRLCLEISEIALLDDLETTNDALRALKDLGVRLAIDDFGTGRLVAHLPAPVPVRRAEGRLEFHRGFGHERGRRRHRRRHDRHGARTRHDRRRRKASRPSSSGSASSSSGATAPRATSSRNRRPKSERHRFPHR